MRFITKNLTGRCSRFCEKRGNSSGWRRLVNICGSQCRGTKSRWRRPPACAKRPGVKSLIAILLLGVSSAFGGLSWETKLHEFTKEPADKEVAARFPFKNTSDRTVSIRSMKSSCGCTAAGLSKKTFAPGESGEITAKFTFGSRKGAQRKSITVQTDDKETHILELRVMIAEGARISPSFLFWRQNSPNEPRAVEIKTRKEIVGVRSSDQRLVATLETVVPRQEYVVYVNPTDTTKPLAGKITIMTSGEKPETFVVQARVK